MQLLVFINVILQPSPPQKLTNDLSGHAPCMDYNPRAHRLMCFTLSSLRLCAFNCSLSAAVKGLGALILTTINSSSVSGRVQSITCFQYALNDHQSGTSTSELASAIPLHCCDSRCLGQTIPLFEQLLQVLRGLLLDLVLKPLLKLIMRVSAA